MSVASSVTIDITNYDPKVFGDLILQVIVGLSPKQRIDLYHKMKEDPRGLPNTVSSLEIETDPLDLAALLLAIKELHIKLNAQRDRVGEEFLFSILQGDPRDWIIWQKEEVHP